MKPRTAETLAWVLIYGGLLLASLGLFLRPAQALAGAVVIAFGLLAAAAGVALIWWRSKMSDEPAKEA